MDTSAIIMFGFFTRYALNQKYCKLFETTSFPHKKYEWEIYLFMECFMDSSAYPRKESNEAVILWKEILDEAVK